MRTNYGTVSTDSLLLSFLQTQKEPEPEPEPKKMSRQKVNKQALLPARQSIDRRENRDLVYILMRMRWL